ncbi:MAG TPA: O-antigen ligase family protein [Cellvibrionaceae bacterium]
MLPLLWLFIRYPMPSWLRDPLFLTCTGLIVWLSLNSILVSNAHWPAKLDQLRWGAEVWLFIAGLMVTVPIWLTRPKMYGLLFSSLILLAVVVALLPYVYVGDYNSRLIGRGFLSHPIQGASVLLVYWGIAFFLLGFERSLSRLELVVLITAGIGVLVFAILSQSRGPMLATALILPCFFLSYLWHRHSASWRLILISLSAVVLVLSLLWALSPEVFTSWLHANMAARGLSYRPEIWSSTLAHWQTFALWGTGNATSFVNTAPGAELLATLGIEFDHTHNIFLQFWLIGGGAALLLFVFILATMTIKLLHREHTMRHGLSALGLLLIMVLSNLTDTARPLASPTADWVLLWLPILMVVEALRKSSERSTSRDPLNKVATAR